MLVADICCWSLLVVVGWCCFMLVDVVVGFLDVVVVVGVVWCCRCCWCSCCWCLFVVRCYLSSVGC